MKQNRTYSILAFMLALLFFCTPLLASTISKFVAREETEFNGSHYLDYTVNSVFEVTSQEELFAAINHGYTYVQLSKDIENPLIVTQKAENLHSDLILDLNGIEIQRNGYEPILNIGEGVRLTVVDTSEEQTGGLYNPVGSVFNITGGTLTVVAGRFESGPRYSEYWSYNENILDSEDALTRRTVVLSAAQQVRYTQNGETDVRSAPIIKSYPVRTGEIVYNHGNLYFDKAVTRGGFTVSADTYCYYRTSEDKAAGNPSEIMADWHYSYFVTKENYEYHGASLGAGDSEEDFVEITVYGYENTIYDASQVANAKDYYAAIQMQSGRLEVQSGAFFSYFGQSTTACVNASGGTIEIVRGNFSTRIPNAASVIYDGVAQREDPAVAFDTNYFNNFEWSSTPGGKLAASGRGYCILNGNDANVIINTGTFYASNNNIVSMESGTLSVSGGNFIKKNTVALGAADTSGAAIYMQNGNLTVMNATYEVGGTYGAYNSAIHMLAGELSVFNSKYTVTGDNTVGIKMLDGKLTVENSSYTLYGNNTFGIHSTVSGVGNFNLRNTSFTMANGNDQTGVYAENGRVSLVSTAVPRSLVSISGQSGYGIRVANGGSVYSENYNYNLAGARSYGISSEGGSVEIAGGNVTLASNDACYGVYAVSTDASVFNISLSGAHISVGYGGALRSGTVGANFGVYLATSNNANRVTLTDTDIDCHEIALGVAGGSLRINGSGTIRTEKASAVAVAGGSVEFSEGSHYTLTSYNTRSDATTNSYELVLPYLSGSTLVTVSYPNTDGIYVQGGSFASYGNLNLTHTGLLNPIGYADYTQATVTSYAVRVTGGNVTVKRGSIIAKVGGGICCSAGEMYMGDPATLTSSVSGLATDGSRPWLLDGGVTVMTEGVEMNNTFHFAVPGVPSGNWQVPYSVNGGHAIELNGGNITVYNGTYTSAFGNGVSANGDGTINIYNGEFYGGMPDAAKGKSGPSACYGVKVIGGATVHIRNGFYDGGNGGAFLTGITDLAVPYETDITAGWMRCTYTYGGGSVELYVRVTESYDYQYKTLGGTLLTEVSGVGLVDGLGNTVCPEGGHQIQYEISGGERPARAYVYRGEFGHNGGSDAFNIYDYATVIFGAHTEAETAGWTATDFRNAIVMYGTWTSIAVNTITNSDILVRPQVDVYYGTYNTGSTYPYSVYFDAECDVLTVYNRDLASGYYSAIDLANAREGWMWHNAHNTEPEYFDGT